MSDTPMICPYCALPTDQCRCGEEAQGETKVTAIDGSGTAPDWTLRRDLKPIHPDNYNAALEASVSAMRVLGATHARATILPSIEKPETLIVEGWRVRPDEETPPPAQADGSGDANG